MRSDGGKGLGRLRHSRLCGYIRQMRFSNCVRFLRGRGLGRGCLAIELVSVAVGAVLEDEGHEQSVLGWYIRAENFLPFKSSTR